MKVTIEVPTRDLDPLSGHIKFENVNRLWVDGYQIVAPYQTTDRQSLIERVNALLDQYETKDARPS